MNLRPVQSVSALSSITLLALLALPGAARAAQAYDSCTGFITVLPTTLTTQGTWCMKQDLSSSLASGNMITVDANNVIIDCNGFKLGGIGAGDATAAVGIRASGRSNTTVRGCNVRGFQYGVFLSSVPGGHVVEDSRFDNNTSAAIVAIGEGSVIRRNLVTNTGGSTIPVEADGAVYGILVNGRTQVLDNIVRGVAMSADGNVQGIAVGLGDSSLIARNSVADVVHLGKGTEAGIDVQASPATIVRDNNLSGNDLKVDTGIQCDSLAVGTRDNASIRHGIAIDGCGDLGGNSSL